MVHKLQPLRHATRLEVSVEGLKLQLLASTDPPETMVTAAISGLSLALSRNQDLSGEDRASGYSCPCGSYSTLCIENMS